jgi:divalent metal cation (Fe/Co/Zn/Cd) transporter
MLGVVALLGLLVNRILHWWWGDRVAALGVAVVAAFEAYRILKQQTKPDSVS